MKACLYDFRTNIHLTLKTNTLKYEDLEDFVGCYNPDNRFQRQEAERFRAFTYDELIQRDKANLDIFWLTDESLEPTPMPTPAPTPIMDELANFIDVGQGNSIPRSSGCQWK